MDWQELLYRENLTEDELRRIPGASNENYIAAKDYFGRKYGMDQAALLEGLNISPEDFNNPQNWLNPLQEQRFNINVFRQTPGLFTHHDYYQAGVDFQFTGNSLFILLFKALPASRIIKEINRNVRKFNNEYIITPVDFRKGSSYFLIEPYPYCRQQSVGHECRFTQGVFSANFEIHRIRSYTSRHLICFQRLENILRRAYGHLPLTYRDDGRLIYLNGTPLGRHVRLQTRPIGGREIFFNAVDETADLTHPQTPPNAVEITRDFTWEGRTLFYQGEFYNAPY